LYHHPEALTGVLIRRPVGERGDEEDTHVIRRIREISIAVRNLNECLADFGRKLALTPEEVQEESKPPVQSRFASLRIGDSSLALMEPMGEESPIGRFLKRRGEGIFSVTLEVDDIEEASKRLRANGVELVLDKPMVLENTRAADKVYRKVIINFTKPSSLHGVVFEIQQLEE
jgi:methylmalonyl-CoA/ethylmalonyl-CoA epimerase